MRKQEGKVIAKILLIAYIVFVFWFCVISRTETVYDIRALGWSFYGMWNHWWQGFLYFQTIGNVLMYLPFGFLISKIWEPKTMLIPFIAGIVLCGTVELLQFIGNCGTLDFDDVINNIAGTLIGFYLNQYSKKEKSVGAILGLTFPYVLLGVRVLIVGLNR